MTIRAGSSFNTHGGSVHKIEKIIQHEKFWQNEIGNSFFDVAVVKVKNPFVFDDTRKPAELYNVGEKAIGGALSVISGWGYDENNTLPIQLRSVVLPIINKLLCNKIYEIEQGGIGFGQICAGLFGIGKKDSCGGDSG